MRSTTTKPTIDCFNRRTAFGDKISAAREKKGWSQLRLAMEMNLETRCSISSWERGYRVPTFPMAVRLARALGISLDELAEGVA
jgi:transcriptional regulator with XRE-family HTH domain